ncbi:methylmalonate-semialdehyde dehydrogenase (CoA acylating) [Endozoicomonas sp. OPT23]|uniref:CoA-acylating methylmalonate-semialdehyde dehydrogenase n=1 Tax=Endozoicomonas sp. OPT23 TaxID=2072845 RepID=UPI00129B736B|nr:CoA-acylating methylmalonate-semialdehyde dehydrogenase [Endozoicomonas sp. OPT23]MRI33636.1 methylmalonate-semialdehyde dehydrogenase (CoA acylating) [Endozoicomonas sp. OPT23]
MKTIYNFINGHSEPSVSDRVGAVFNPATGEQTAVVQLSTADETAQAIEIASRAFPAWSLTSPLKRARIMARFKELVEQNADELAHIISREHGKILSDAKGELTRGLEVVEFATGIPHLLKGEHSMNVGSGVDSWSQMMPLGVCAGVVPFNFPVMVPMWMFPVALACGNTFVLKPSEKVPGAMMRLAELLKEAGLPDGVFNIVNGDREVADVLLTHPKVEAISFVGSTPVAEHIYNTGCKHGKRVQALGGAKNHMVIMPDADMEAAANALMGAAYGAAGERCMAISVAVPVGEGTAEKLLSALMPKIDALKVGPGIVEGPENDMGALISEQHLAKVTGYINTGVNEGAELLIDGRGLTVEGHEGGHFTGPSLFDRVTPEMTVYKEEIFGPVLSVCRVDSFKDAVELINNHEYGNGTALFTRDGKAAREFAQHIQVGMVGVNVPVPVPMAFHSFGGWKKSLFGPLHMHGPDSVRFYTRMKMVTTRWTEHDKAESVFTMPTMG